MRVISAFLCSILVLFVTVGCHPTPPNLDPATTRMWQADQAQVILGELQHTAIEFNKVKVCDAQNANCHPLLSDKDTGVVVDAVMASLKSLRVAPQGWEQTGLTALDQISNALDEAGKTQLSSYVQAARVALGLILKQPTPQTVAPIKK